jgi:hypothetical protein
MHVRCTSRTVDLRLYEYCCFVPTTSAVASCFVCLVRTHRMRMRARSLLLPACALLPVPAAVCLLFSTTVPLGTVLVQLYSRYSTSTVQPYGGRTSCTSTGTVPVLLVSILYLDSADATSMPSPDGSEIGRCRLQQAGRPTSRRLENAYSCTVPPPPPRHQSAM